MLFILVYIVLFLLACGEVATDPPDRDRSSSSVPLGNSSSNIAQSSSSSSSFDMEIDWQIVEGEFMISKSLITQGQYKAVMRVNPAKGLKNDALPIEGVSWYNAMEFCEKLSDIKGYEISLPTIEEWEQAANPLNSVIEKNPDYWEWTYEQYRKGLGNNYINEYQTDPIWDDIQGGYISFRIVRGI